MLETFFSSFHVLKSNAAAEWVAFWNTFILSNDDRCVIAKDLKLTMSCKFSFRWHFPTNRHSVAQAQYPADVLVFYQTALHHLYH